VGVEDALVSLGAGVRDQAVPGLGDTLDVRDLGRQPEQLGHLDAAARLLEPLTADTDHRWWLPAVVALCRCYRETGDLSRSIDVGSRAQEHVRALELEGTDDAIRLAISLVGAYYERGDESYAAQLCQAVVDQADRTGSRAARAAAYRNSSMIAHSRGQLDEAVSCSVETGRALAVAGLHPATGGDGTLLCSGDMLLQALVACAGVTLRAVATSLGIDVAGGTVAAEGDLDFRGTLAVSKDAPVGFRSIRLAFDLDTDASAEQIQTLIKLTERYCVVYQTLSRPAEMAISVNQPAQA